MTKYSNVLFTYNCPVLLFDIFRIAPMSASLHKFLVVSRLQFHTKVPAIGKRGHLLTRLVSDRDKKKNWHLAVLGKPDAKTNIFEKVHKPARRGAVLNNLFIENITDVLSTGDVVPEIIGSGIEITGVKISPDYRILNVFWQIPLSKMDNGQDLQALLATSAPKLRSELINRHVLGKVPKIYFVQDKTNEMLVEFEKALASADLGPESESSVVPDQEFLDDLLLFDAARKLKNQKLEEERKAAGKTVKTEIKKPEVEAEATTVDEDCSVIEEQTQQEQKEKWTSNPPDMKSDIFGLDHAALMEKVITAKKRATKKTVYTEGPEISGDDLFNMIPGETLFKDSEREKLLLKFCVERKIQQRKLREMKDDDEEENYISPVENDLVENLDDFEPDYYEDEIDR